MAEKKEYRIKVQGQLVPVSEEVYVTYHRMAYSKIAAEMMRRGLRYHSHTTEWNKHM